MRCRYSLTCRISVDSQPVMVALRKAVEHEVERAWGGWAFLDGRIQQDSAPVGDVLGSSLVASAVEVSLRTAAGATLGTNPAPLVRTVCVCFFPPFFLGGGGEAMSTSLQSTPAWGASQ